LVTYQNLGILLTTLAAGWAYSRDRWREIFTVALAWFVLGMGVVGLSLKLAHGATASIISPFWTGPQGTVSLPTSYKASFDYTIPDRVPLNVLIIEDSEEDADRFPKASDHLSIPKQEVSLPVLGDQNFGVARGADVSLANESLVCLNIAAFPWNEIFANGNLVSPGTLLREGPRFALRLPGGKYRIEYRFHPDRIWRYLRGVSWMMFSVAIVLYGFICLRRMPARVKNTACRGASFG